MLDATLLSRKEIGTSGLKEFSFGVPALATDTVSGSIAFLVR